FARSRGDTRAAADFFEVALSEDPDNPALRHRAFLLMLADGRFERARQLAERQPQGSGNLEDLFLATEAIRKGRFDEAYRRLMDNPENSAATLLRPLLLAWVEAGRGNADAAIASLSALEQNDGLKPFATFHEA